MSGKIEHWESFVPQELPDGVFELLPSISFKENDKFQFKTNVNLLIWQVSSIFAYENKINMDKLFGRIVMKDSVDSGGHMLKMLFCVILIAAICITALPKCIVFQAV
jgi:hypothetical protein